MNAKRYPDKITGWPSNFETVLLKKFDSSAKGDKETFNIMGTDAML
jgi:hypothetical protein